MTIPLEFQHQQNRSEVQGWGGFCGCGCGCASFSFILCFANRKCRIIENKKLEEQNSVSVALDGTIQAATVDLEPGTWAWRNMTLAAARQD